MLPLRKYSPRGGIVFASALWVLTSSVGRADLLVLDTGGSGQGPGYVWRFNERTGEPRLGLGVENEGLSALAATSAGDILVTGNVLGVYSLHRFDRHGEYRGSMSDAWLGQMRGVTQGPDGALYALRFEDGNQRWRIARLNGATAGTFVDRGAKTMASPVTMVLGPENKFLVADRERGVLRFNATTGAFLGVLVPLGENGLIDPTDVLVGDDGVLWVSSGELNAVFEFDARTGDFRKMAVPANTGGLRNPQGLARSRNGDLYVTSRDTQQVLRFDAATGAFHGVAAEFPQVQYAGRVVFVKLPSAL